MNAIVTTTTGGTMSTITAETEPEPTFVEQVQELPDHVNEIDEAGAEPDLDLTGFTTPDWAFAVEDYEPDAVDGSQVRVCSYVEGDDPVTSKTGIVADGIDVVVRGVEGQSRRANGNVVREGGVDLLIDVNGEDLSWSLDLDAAREVARRIGHAAWTVGRPEKSERTRPTPSFEPPVKVKVAKWADDIEPWAPDGPTLYTRRVCHTFYDGTGFGFEASYLQDAYEDGRVEDGHLEISFNMESIDGTPQEIAEGARALAHDLLEAADMLDGPRPMDMRAFRPELGRTQKMLIAAIKERIKMLPLGQNELAIGGGYGPDEFSALMTGRRLMDVNDLDRIARALDLTPLDLLAAASGEANA